MADKDNSFNFRWGVPWLDDKDYIQIPGFIKRHYAELGIKPTDMMMIGHLSSYRYNTPNGEARPSLRTIANEMGYTKDDQVRKMVTRLEDAGFLSVTRIPGLPSVYDFGELAKKCMILDLGEYPPNEGDSTPQKGGRRSKATKKERKYFR